MLIKLLLISLLVMALVIVFLGIRILLKPKGQFPETHISRNEEMKKRGIECAQHTDIGCNPGSPEGCSSCGINLSKQ